MATALEKSARLVRDFYRGGPKWATIFSIVEENRG
jgi:hypothetical protein